MKKKKILLVDSQPDFVETQKAALVEYGYEVLTATTGRDALDTVRVEMPDIVVVDLILEKHDTGFEVTRQIKSDPLFGKTPVLMVSSAAEATEHHFSKDEDGYWMKVDEYVEKPIEPEALRQLIEKLLAARAS